MTPMDKLRIIFFGTPEFSVSVLESLCRGGLTPALVVTAPDAPKGRGLIMTPSPIDIYAQRVGIPFITPESLKNVDALQAITDVCPHVHVIAAYGKILPERILEIPKFGTLNVHPSLLPKYRGPSPVASALLNGETETGVSIMLTDAKLDHGPVVAQKTHYIDPNDTTLSLTTSLFSIGGELLVQTIPDWVAGKIIATPQDETLATTTKKFTKADGRLDWNTPAQLLEYRVRACTPWPSAWTLQADGGRLIILRADAITDAPNIPIGTLFKTHDSFAVRTAEGSLLLSAVTRAGKSPETISNYTSWLNEGDILN